MFVLSKLSDLIRVPPHTFSIPIQEALSNEIHTKYCNKIINNLGLAISLWDILDIKDGLLKPGDGASFIEVQFRLIVWKPFVGEVIEGVVSDCTIEGIKVKLNFFDEIFIPKAYVFENCSYRAAERAWVWQPDEETELFIDINERIRFRIEEEVFINVKPKPEEQQQPHYQIQQQQPQQDKPNAPPPYAIVASCQTEGMGCVAWWD